MLYIVDIQYYLHGTMKILKEACILPVMRPLESAHFAFKPPFPMHQLTAKDLTTVNYIHRYLDSLHWNEGLHTQEEFLDKLPNGCVILCLGLEKSLFLQSLLPLCNILNVNVSFGNLQQQQSVCLHCPFRKHAQCAFLRAYQLYMYVTSCN
jgi:hypothetical protein